MSSGKAASGIGALDRARDFTCYAEAQFEQTIEAKKRGFLQTGAEIVKRETPLGLYKGLGAVLTGIVPKMAIRFTSYEWYKQLLADADGKVSGRATFLGKCISCYEEGSVIAWST
ncbi:hypothetical protein MRB53_039239 [Persea americana]|nr:hypothetical protein MRB53_039239 [Persea americana]